MNATVWIPTTEAAANCRLIEENSYGSSLSLEQWRRLIKSKKAVAICYENKAVAVVAAIGGKWQLIMVAVTPTARREGIGSELVSYLGETLALQLRLPETNYIGLKFAVANGFVVDRVERNGYGNCDAIWLVRSAGE